jgi:predicted RNase H-like nuclease (RuvC/YqgF family)
MSQEEKVKAELKSFTEENDFYKKRNADFEADNAKLNKEISQTIQKIDINYLLKEVDIEDLKLLAQNNKMMTSALHNLLGKWESIAKIEGEL